MSTSYRVLARKYRPQKLDELVGQELLVRTLSQAISEHRLAHAFVLYGIRGVGKTTTARILAKALNCEHGPTIDPCGVCSSCVAIVEDRHLDVIEVDAASRTGVDDIREIIDTARYKAVQGMFKIFIIDEVHMLSRSAFNALLKTLEEPPAHVKFIFATTEIKKIPDTILSRCMRFDLSRIKSQDLFQHFKAILAQENIQIEDDALHMIVRASDGSARDGLSLLDQAIVLTQSVITAESIRDMLGLIDRGRVFELLQSLLAADAEKALISAKEVLDHGSDSLILLQELLDVAYTLTCYKTAPSAMNQTLFSETDRQYYQEIAPQYPMPRFMQVWQLLMRGYEETLRSPHPQQTALMIVLRICYVSALPSAEDLATMLYTGRQISTDIGGQAIAPLQESRPTIQTQAETLPEPHVPSPSPAPQVYPSPKSFDALVKLMAQAREPILYSYLMQDVHLVHFEPGVLTLRLSPRAPRAMIQDLTRKLEQLTQQKWRVVITEETGAPTLAHQTQELMKAEEAQVLKEPIVQEILTNFPGTHATVDSKKG